MLHRLTGRTTVILTLLSLTGTGAAQEFDVSRFVDQRYSETARIARTLWEYAEVGYQEEKSSALLQTTLLEEGFDVGKTNVWRMCGSKPSQSINRNDC